LNEKIVYALRENDDIILENNSFRDELDSLKLSKYYSKFGIFLITNLTLSGCSLA